MPITIHVSAGMNTSPESMGKIAFKEDNTILVVFAKSFTNEKNPFASAIYYASSTDNGKNWSAQQFLHSDTTHSYGRGFFDITRLKNGEVAAIWLDGRFGKSIKGSSLFYAATKKNMGFGQDKCLNKGTCECCRTDILQDEDGDIHIAYRSILFPPSLLGKQVRDMVYSLSKDNGASFSTPKVISKDNWTIEGCPHTGPSLAIHNNSVNVAWFTAGGNSGIYYTTASKMEANFQKRRLLAPTGKHPQMVSFRNGKMAMVCEVSNQSTTETSESKQQTMGNLMNHAKAGNAKIVLRIFDNKGIQNKIINITDGRKADHHPVIYEIANNLLIAWEREEDGYSTICYTVLRDN